MPLGDILKPKSEEEIKDLEQRGFRKDGGKWRFTIDIEDIIEEYDKNEDTEVFRQSILDLLKSKTDDVGILVDEEQTSKFVDIIGEFSILDPNPEPDEIDNVLGMLYDWADNNDVWINSF